MAVLRLHDAVSDTKLAQASLSIISSFSAAVVPMMRAVSGLSYDELNYTEAVSEGSFAATLNMHLSYVPTAYCF